jgi:hypothetical protein
MTKASTAISPLDGVTETERTPLQNKKKKYVVRVRRAKINVFLLFICLLVIWLVS